METTWQKGIHFPAYPALSGDVTADVVIIGGGITGITTAYLLAKAGKKVVVLEKDTLHDSVTAYTTGFLAADVDTDLYKLEKMFGKRNAGLVWQSGVEAIDRIEAIVRDEKIDCEFMRVPEYFYATGKTGLRELQREAEHVGSLGYTMEKRSLPFTTDGVFALDNQGKFHAIKYLLALRTAAEKYGAVFYEHTKALAMHGTNPVRVMTKNGIVEADYAIVATYKPFKNPFNLILRKGMYVSYVYELSVLPGIFPEGIYLDDKNPYHYFRIDAGDTHDRIIIGGADHRKSIPMNQEKNFAELRKYMQKMFGDMEYSIVAKWRGPILEPTDGLPVIGSYSKRKKNWLVASAFSGNGMTYSMTAARIFTAIILGQENEYTKLFSPTRCMRLRALWVKGGDYTMEFVNGALKNMFRSRK